MKNDDIKEDDLLVQKKKWVLEILFTLYITKYLKKVYQSPNSIDKKFILNTINLLLVRVLDKEDF